MNKIRKISERNFGKNRKRAVSANAKTARFSVKSSMSAPRCIQTD